MEFRSSKREAGNQSKLENKSETSEQRLRRNTRFLKSLAIGTTLLAAGMSGVEARPEPSGSALQRQGHDNTTGLTHAFNQQEFNNLSHPTALEFNPYTYKVTPELLDHLRKVGVPDPEQHIRSVQQREQRQNILQIDKGTERLTPEKIDPEIWRNVRKMLTEKTPISDQQNDTRRELDGHTSIPVILVHGITAAFEPYGSDAGSNCNTNYWGDTINFLEAQGYNNINTIKFYTGDTNCNIDLHDPAMLDQSLCDNFSPGSEGTNNEDLNHVSCLLAQFLNQFYAGGQNVILVGHSMGGIIVRNTMYLAETQGGQQGMPSDIGYVTDAVTFNTPHAGVNDEGSVGCYGCWQINQLASDGSFMTNLVQNAQNPQTSAGFTQWTVVGSECDLIVGSSLNPDGPANAVAMQASHGIMYSKSDSATCYNHTSALGDSSTATDATLYYCDTSDPTGFPCGTDYQDATSNWGEITTGTHGLQTMYEAIQQ